MRTPRVVILAAFLLSTISLTSVLLRSSHHKRPTYSTGDRDPQPVLGGLFSFFSPISLFPPNAIISLTDDNTTSFLARPAAFGPPLPIHGLSGQLWIGSGFGDDHGLVAGAEGELGCSDVPGWSDGTKSKLSAVTKATKPPSKNQRRDIEAGASLAEHSENEDADDNTDDYLNSHSTSARGRSSKHEHDQASHADIQSIQEGAEIAGKIVLLSRGGCGFLEKVKWTQKRGGIALVVGDNTRGGPLIQMYARGDTSNVSIPSIFTSHTTAHLLSSLMPAGSYLEDSIDENGKVVTKVQQDGKPKKGNKKTNKQGGTKGPLKAIPTSKPAAKAPATKLTTTKKNTKPKEARSGGWLGSLFSRSRTQDIRGKTWILEDEWDASVTTNKRPLKGSKEKVQPPSKSAKGEPADDFIIGEHDWRAHDHLNNGDTNKADTIEKKAAARLPDKDLVKEKPKPSGGKANSKNALEGGSITPGSGEYAAGSANAKEKSEKATTKATKTSDKSASGDKDKDKADKAGLVTTLFGEDDDESYIDSPSAATTTPISASPDGDEDTDSPDGDTDPRQGLWITITPTSGASPFFDTLLILVVSPLVTLFIVYALLVVRSRLRRRRWRAPKSVVERLPVRTYQTIASSSSSSTSSHSSHSSSNLNQQQNILLSPTEAGTNPSTPLLHRSVRPRSRTTSAISEPGMLLRTNSDGVTRVPSPLPSPLLSPLPLAPPPPTVSPSNPSSAEKPAGAAAAYRPYTGRQVECVVCLEEYVDGVSRVMSLPCGHEFHVDCITPWLVTRRRTCPICKGDVVRSLQRASTGGGGEDVDGEEVGGGSGRESPSAALLGGDEEDLEQGVRRREEGRTLARTPIVELLGSWTDGLVGTFRSLVAGVTGGEGRRERDGEEYRSR
jgi:hypothetical protein